MKIERKKFIFVRIFGLFDEKWEWKKFMNHSAVIKNRKTHHEAIFSLDLDDKREFWWFSIEIWALKVKLLTNWEENRPQFFFLAQPTDFCCCFWFVWCGLLTIEWIYGWRDENEMKTWKNRNFLREFWNLLDWNFIKNWKFSEKT